METIATGKLMPVHTNPRIEKRKVLPQAGRNHTRTHHVSSDEAIDKTDLHQTEYRLKATAEQVLRRFKGNIVTSTAEPVWGSLQ